MGFMKQIAISTGLLPKPGELGEHLLAMQYEHLKNHIPLLYLTIGFYFAMAVIFIASQIPYESVNHIVAGFILPSIIVPFSFLRTVIWYRRRHDKFEAEKVKKIIISLTAISSTLAILCGYWAVLSWTINSVDNRSYLALIMAMGGFSVAYCLSIVPIAATFSLIAALLPLNIVMLFSGETFLMAAGLTVTIAILYFVGLLRRHHMQMIQMIELQLQMHDLAHTDPLTGLLNRRALIEEYSEITDGDGNSAPDYLKTDCKDSDVSNITMVMMDLDSFKPINDKLGHAAGDIMLKMIADRMRAHIGEYSLIARIGGDEFAIMFVNKPRQFCQQMVGSLSHILSEGYPIDGEQRYVGISYGLAHDSGDISSIEKLLSRADKKLYIMKAKKKQQRRKEKALDNIDGTSAGKVGLTVVR